ncbi:hypothetical protein CYMTET_29173 [Cymbomonas tetramitiformis]|uniref:Chromo domain-containing protein n=1 Tax=Cymbomonas tetramitiformis TaxID=36881 RepID=A0AAE0KV65_9CHLO|nr:hypothetical protein CYMTET_29173 [Cymbomonas tetramitiformis]
MPGFPNGGFYRGCPNQPAKGSQFCQPCQQFTVPTTLQGDSDDENDTDVLDGEVTQSQGPRLRSHTKKADMSADWVLRLVAHRRKGNKPSNKMQYQVKWRDADRADRWRYASDIPEYLLIDYWRDKVRPLCQRTGHLSLPRIFHSQRIVCSQDMSDAPAEIREALKDPRGARPPEIPALAEEARQRVGLLDPRAQSFLQEDGSEKVSVDCSTTKGDWSKAKQVHARFRSAGLFALVSPCGVILLVRELYGTESISQVVVILLSFFRRINRVPRLIGYDDGCHLHGFIHLAKRVQMWSGNVWWAALMTIKVFIDRFHHPNHVDAWCKKYMSPERADILPEMRGTNPDGSPWKVNTEICEQTFSWMRDYKSITSHMNEPRFKWFLLRMCWMKNMDTMDRLRGSGMSPRCRPKGDNFAMETDI